MSLGSSLNIVTTEEPWFDFRQKPKHFPIFHSMQTSCAATQPPNELYPGEWCHLPGRQSPRGGKMGGKTGDNVNYRGVGELGV